MYEIKIKLKRIENEANNNDGIYKRVKEKFAYKIIDLLTKDIIKEEIKSK